MERLAVCVNDAEQARRTLGPLMAAAAPMQCLVVLCPPGLGRRVGRWLTEGERQRWRADWAAALRGRLAPQLAQAAPGAHFEWLTAQRPLAEFVRELRRQHGAGLRLLDARRTPVGASLEPMQAGQAPVGGRVAAPVAIASSLSLMLALTD